MKTLVIDPITRLEGHGKIKIFLDDQGEVLRAVFQVPELRGFEAFCAGRPAEEMPQITSRICGVCPTAHHMASAVTLDDLYRVEPPPAARAIRELIYHAFVVEDHALHFFFLGGPDLFVGPSAPKLERNVLGLIATVGQEIATQVITMRRRLRELIASLGGKVIHPVYGLPGGVAKAVAEGQRSQIQELARDTLLFARFSLELFHSRILKGGSFLEALRADRHRHQTHYMGVVDQKNCLSFCGGQIRVVGPDGAERAKFSPRDYARYIGEHVEEWTYVKFPYLREPGWRGFVDGADSGVYRVAPLARLNVSDGLATPAAQVEFLRFYETLGERPAHNLMANHWARLIEMLYAAERLVELGNAPELTSTDIRNMGFCTPVEGFGVVEAPRGTLLHHYQTDERGVLTACHLLVATQGNTAAICMSVEKAAKALIHRGVVDDGLLNQVEMAFRAYDPCLACSTHAHPSQPSLLLELVRPDGTVIRSVPR